MSRSMVEKSSQITQQTAGAIALAYREIETAEKLLSSMTEARQRRETPDIRDAFGRLQSGLQLGVPSGSNCHRLYDVPWSLVVPILETHIATQKAIVATLSVKAITEMQVREEDSSDA